MSSRETIAVLNRLIGVHSRSLAMYLSYASPTWLMGDEHGREVLRDIAADQAATAERLAALVVENHGIVDEGVFPLIYTGWHDLSFAFLLTKLIENQTSMIQTIEEAIAELALVPFARALAEEALGAAKGHLETLQELATSATRY